VGQCSGRPPTAKRLTVGGGAADDGAMTVRVLRLVLAVLIVGAALGGAFVLHGYRLRYLSTCPAIGAPSGSRCLRELRPGWVDPAALGVIVLGVAVAIGVVAGRRRGRRSVYADAYLAALIVAAALIGAFVLHGQQKIVYPYGTFGKTLVSVWWATQRPGWADPAALGVLVLGLAMASGVVAAHGRNRQSAGGGTLGGASPSHSGESAL